MNHEPKKILVLGSEGLIGTYLCQHLSCHTQGRFMPIRYDIRLPRHEHYDLSSDCVRWSLLPSIQEADFVVFLAFDVGGAKYLNKKQKNVSFKTNNMKIMQNVFDCLAKEITPFIFASTMMTELEGSSYGLLKKLGEEFTRDLGGITTRFWNVFGVERPGIRAHATTDFIQQTARHGSVQLLTTGEEVRQYMWAGDVAKALSQIMEDYFDEKKVEGSYDISSGEWVQTKTMAQWCIDAVHGPELTQEYVVVPGPDVDPIQPDSKIEPNLKAYHKLMNFDSSSHYDDDINFYRKLASIHKYLEVNHD